MIKWWFYIFEVSLEGLKLGFRGFGLSFEEFGFFHSSPTQWLLKKASLADSLWLIVLIFSYLFIIVLIYLQNFSNFFNSNFSWVGKFWKK